MDGVEVREASADDVEELTTVAVAVELADPTSRPEIPPITADEVEAHHFRGPPEKPSRSWLALDAASGAPLGWVFAGLPLAANRSHVQVLVEVAPERAGRGVGSSLLRTALESIDPSRTTVAAHAPAAAVAWCEALGLPSCQVVRESRLDLTDLDLDLARSWLAPDEAITAGYRMISWRGPTPDEHLAAVCVALTSMADAPLDGTDFDFGAVTPERVQAGEGAASARVHQFSSLVLGPDGSPAGFTELGVIRNRPVLGDEGDTVVVAEHRGHRLGRWLKATNLLAAIGAQPELRFVNTFNAESNPWMLSINEAMAFRPFREVHTVQGPTASVLDALRRRVSV